MTAFEDWKSSDVVTSGSRPSSGDHSSGASSQPERSGERNRFADSSESELGESARHVKETVKDNAKETFSQVRRGADRLMDQQKSVASERLQTYADSMRQAAQCLTEQNPQISRLLDHTAGRLGSVGTYLREHQVSDMVSQVNRFGRQHPLILVGGMFVAGALAARFFKASQQRQPEPNGDDGERSFEEYAQAPFISQRDQHDQGENRPQRTGSEARDETSSDAGIGSSTSPSNQRGTPWEGGAQ